VKSAARLLFVTCARLRENLLRVDVRPGLDFVLAFFNPREACVRKLDRGALALRELCGELGRRALVEIRCRRQNGTSCARLSCCVFNASLYWRP